MSNDLPKLSIDDYRPNNVKVMLMSHDGIFKIFDERGDQLVCLDYDGTVTLDPKFDNEYTRSFWKLLTNGIPEKYNFAEQRWTVKMNEIQTCIDIVENSLLAESYQGIGLKDGALSRLQEYQKQMQEKIRIRGKVEDDIKI